MRLMIKVIFISSLLLALSSCGTAAYLAGAAVGTGTKAAIYVV